MVDGEQCTVQWIIRKCEYDVLRNFLILSKEYIIILVAESVSSVEMLLICNTARHHIMMYLPLILCALSLQFLTFTKAEIWQ
jgi:hypothetical protein